MSMVSTPPKKVRYVLEIDGVPFELAPLEYDLFDLSSLDEDKDD